MAENLALFARFYYRPIQAASEALDNASFGFALVARRARHDAVDLRRRADRGLAAGPWQPPSSHERERRASSRHFHGCRYQSRVSITYAGGLFGLFAIFVVMTPVSIATVAAWDGLGSAGVVLRREYLSFVVCGLFAWAASNLPFGLLLTVTGRVPFHDFLLQWRRTRSSWVCSSYACAQRSGRRYTHAVVAALAGWVCRARIVLLWPVDRQCFVFPVVALGALHALPRVFAGPGIARRCDELPAGLSTATRCLHVEPSRRRRALSAWTHLPAPTATR